MKADKEDTINWCTSCDNCIELLIRQKNVGCATYDKEYVDALRKIRKEEGLLKAKRT
jgi:epoxyqueuosine reductase QueG